MIKTQGTRKEDALHRSLGGQDNLAQEEGNTGLNTRGRGSQWAQVTRIRRERKSHTLEGHDLTGHNIISE